mgnify:FL=1|jgi:RNA binding exosome subunit
MSVKIETPYIDFGRMGTSPQDAAKNRYGYAVAGNMAQTFHWVDVMTICHATEREELLLEVMEALTGEGNVTLEETEGHFGNRIAILSAKISREKDAEHLFSALGPELLAGLAGELEERIDDDCTFYLRLDKQKAVQGIYAASCGGDVVSVTGKIVSHPARKAKAVAAMETFLSNIIQVP